MSARSLARGHEGSTAWSHLKHCCSCLCCQCGKRSPVIQGYEGRTGVKEKKGFCCGLVGLFVRWSSSAKRNFLFYIIAFSAASLALNIVTAYVAYSSSAVDFSVFPNWGAAVFVTMIVNAVILSASIVFYTRRKKSFPSTRTVTYIIAVLSLCSVAVAFYFEKIQHSYSLALQALGVSDSQNTTNAMQIELDDFSLGLFEVCCYDRGWGYYSIPECSEDLDCEFASLEHGVCSCYHSETTFLAAYNSFSALHCSELQKRSPYNIVAPPNYGGCGSVLINETYVGLPNEFQQQLGHEFLENSTIPLVLTISLSILWAIFTLILLLFTVHDQIIERRILSKRERRRLQLLEMEFVQAEKSDRSEAATAQMPPHPRPTGSIDVALV